MSIDNLRYMKEHLETVSGNGAALYLEGKRVSPEELAWTCCVNEQDVYMPDIITNERGMVKEVRYDRIRER